MRVHRVIGLALVTTLVTINFAAAAVTMGTDITVRVYDATGLDLASRQAALALAATALQAASVDIIWRVCPEGGAAAPCNAPLSPGELSIRIVRSPGFTRHGALPLGDAYIDRGARSGVLATIYLDRVMWLAHEAGTQCPILLGRAIAHELGHLLMATNVHGPVGLMRAFWSQEEVRHSRASDWAFAPLDARAIEKGAQTAHSLIASVLGTR